jgi:hypothetical protein
MDFNSTIDLIIKELREASEIIDDLKKYPGVPALQVELAKLKCKSAGEVIAILKTMKDTLGFTDQGPDLPKQVQKQIPPEEDKPLFVKEMITAAVKEVKEETVVPKMSQAPVVKKPGPSKVEKKEQESSIVADKFSDLSGSFNEQLGTVQGDDDLADILKTKPITSLQAAIGLNDKFLFMSEIFHGNKNDYSQAISRLESVENITDARAIIMSYTGDNNESEAVIQLLDLVKRKLPSNE